VTLSIVLAAFLGIAASGLLVVFAIIAVHNIIVTGIFFIMWLLIIYSFLDVLLESVREEIREELDK